MVHEQGIIIFTGQIISYEDLYYMREAKPEN